MKVAFVTDMHFGYRRFESDAHKQGREAILSAAREADVLILGGDNFDTSLPRMETLAEVTTILCEALAIFRSDADIQARPTPFAHCHPLPPLFPSLLSPLPSLLSHPSLPFSPPPPTLSLPQRAEEVTEHEANLAAEGVAEPLPCPEKIPLESLPPVPYVRKLPTVASGANLDTLGRVKRPLPGSNLKAVSAEIEAGDWDDKVRGMGETGRRGSPI